ncbi:hypothetical protein GCM10010307_51740 [Streptomyces vastus]|uniref:Integrase catalytic domain-containing protein n=1 Tax=Streptomyces vastus TaxID=285451 RepID=A0ABN3RBM2_9ACTN
MGRAVRSVAPAGRASAVAAWSGVVHVAFVVDTFSRRIVGWSASTSRETQLVLDALEMALWQRDRENRRQPAARPRVHRLRHRVVRGMRRLARVIPQSA